MRVNDGGLRLTGGDAFDRSLMLPDLYPVRSLVLPFWPDEEGSGKSLDRADDAPPRNSGRLIAVTSLLTEVGVLRGRLRA